MNTVNIYLTFNGDCEEAFKFYQSVFGGEFSSFSRFNEMPPEASPEPIPETMGKRIMHVSLPISKETELMGSDVGGEWTKSFIQGNNFSISANTPDKEEANRVFNALAEGGKITVPLADSFWGSYFGMLVDKFGINWMVSCDLPSNKN